MDAPVALFHDALVIQLPSSSLPPQVNRNIDLYLRKFILSGGLDAPFLCNEISE